MLRRQGPADTAQRKAGLVRQTAADVVTGVGSVDREVRASSRTYVRAAIRVCLTELSGWACENGGRGE